MVYLVTYADYDVHEVFSAWTTREAAEHERGRLSAAWGRRLDVEEYPLDKEWV